MGSHQESKPTRDYLFLNNHGQFFHFPHMGDFHRVPWSGNADASRNAMSNVESDIVAQACKGEKQKSHSAKYNA